MSFIINVVFMVVLKGGFKVVFEVIKWWFVIEVFDVVGSVVVYVVEVVGVFDKSFFFFGEGRKMVVKLFVYRFGVFIKVDGISELVDGEFNFVVGSFDVFGVVGIVREGSVII